MANPNSDLRTPLSKARGNGASGHGTEHVIHQRALAVGLGIGFAYCAFSILLGTNLSYEAMRGWFHSAFNSTIMALVVICSAFHFALGVQVVIEDYIHKATTKIILTLGTNFLAAIIAMCGVFTILKIYLGA